MIKKKLLCVVLSAATVATSVAIPAISNNSTKVSAATVSSVPALRSTATTLPLDPATKGHLIRNSTFDGGVGLPWTEVETAPAKGSFNISNGTYNVTVTENAKDPSKDNRWAVQFRHRGLTLEQGHTYTVKFTVTADQDCKIYPKIGQQGDPYKEYWNNNWQPYDLKANVPMTVNTTFTMNDPTEKKCEFAFHLAGDCAAAKAPYTFKFDNIYVDDPQFAGYPMTPAEPTNAVRVNQVGYYPNLEKKATVLSSATSPIPWKLVDANGNQVSSGNTTVFGADEESGDNVHIIDFTKFDKEGKGYKLVVNSSDVPSTVSSTESMPFDIGKDIYTKMKLDAIKYFYQNRSGIAITMPYCDRADLARPAGHPSDILANAPKTSDDKPNWYLDSKYSSNYKLDVTGGWYDAGDHGKYVVNGGISTWTMMNQYERAKANGQDLTKAPYGDGTMNIPEGGNKIPDILDESRYNVEFFLKMQVPDGRELAGMVHHKAHDESWTGLGVRPDQDPKTRYLQPPSTAATLNFVAVTAQAARLWKDLDPTFSAKCLAASEKAWDAAQKHPEIYAPLEGSIGGGAYGDTYVKDEFYWAACELYATTGTQKYIDYAKSSKHYLEMPTHLTGGEDSGTVGCFDWGNVQGLGTITLALGKTGLDAADVQKARDNIKTAADYFINTENTQGYGIPVGESQLSDVQSKDGIKGLPWGSNSFVTNSAILMSYANDFGDGNTKYLDGAARAMDYILGCNPNVQSYVTGYGSNPLENPHHRFWANQTDDSFPHPPAGCISGGPNSGLQDPWVKGSGWAPGSRAPEKCFMDNIESWSTNEITINWNAPFAWVSSYLDDNGSKPTPKYVYGDLTGDGSVDIRDLQALQKYITKGTPIQNPAGEKVADLNGDGRVTAIDTIYLKKFLSGSIDKFPVQG